MAYAIISVGGKQYRVQEGQTLLVDRVPTGEGETFDAAALFLGGGDGGPDLEPDVTVTARVVGHELGKKIRIGKYRPKKGYRKHTGYRSRLSRIAIESIGGEAPKRARPKAAETPKPKAADEQPQAAEETLAAPPDYEGLKVGEITDWAKGRHLPTIEAALAYEHANAARKGAIAALEAVLAKRREES